MGKVRIKKKDLIDVVNKLRDNQEPTDNSSVLVSDKYLKDIATAVRMVNGSSDTMKPSEFASNLGDKLYTVTFDGNGGTGGYYHKHKGEKLGTLPESEMTGYGFYGWYDGDTEITSDVIVSGDITYTAKWGNEFYKIKYINTNPEAELRDNPTRYDIDTKTFTLTIPTCSKNYIFAGWTGSNGTTPERTVKIKKGSTGDKTYTANFTKNTHTTNPYTISYNLNGAKLADKHGKNWSVDSDGNLLYKGSKTEHLLINKTNPEWTTCAYGQSRVSAIKNNDENELNIVLNGATTTNKWAADGWTAGVTWVAGVYWMVNDNSHDILKPVWNYITYSLNFDLDGGTDTSIDGIPTTYNVATDSKIIYYPQKDGYIFAGWQDQNTNDKIIGVTIPSIYYTNKKFKAMWITADDIPNPEIINGKKAKDISWSDGTDEEICAMVKAADEGKINLPYYWNVGDIRKVTLSAMEAMAPLTDTHEEQEVELVLLDYNCFQLTNSVKDIYGKDRNLCSFAVGMKNCLKEKGALTDKSWYPNWNKVPRRMWCNTVFKNSFPSSLIGIFKEFYAPTTLNGWDSTMTYFKDYFTFPTVFEVTGEHGEEKYIGNQLKYYRTTKNRIKKCGGIDIATWTRRYDRGSVFEMFIVDTSGDSAAENAQNELGLSPMGCI